MVGSVSVKEDGDAVAGGTHPRQAGSSVPTLRLLDDLGASQAGHRSGPVAGTVVDDDDPVRPDVDDAAQRCDELTDRSFFVQTGDDDPEWLGVA